MYLPKCVGCPNRIRTYVASVKVRSPAARRPGNGTPPEIRTQTEGILSPVPLPVGLVAHGTTGGIRTHTILVLSQPPPTNWATVAFGQCGRTRTYGIYIPNVTLYQLSYTLT